MIDIKSNNYTNYDMEFENISKIKMPNTTICFDESTPYGDLYFIQENNITTPINKKNNREEKTMKFFDNVDFGKATGFAYSPKGIAVETEKISMLAMILSHILLLMLLIL